MLWPTTITIINATATITKPELAQKLTNLILFFFFCLNFFNTVYINNTTAQQQYIYVHKLTLDSNTLKKYSSITGIGPASGTHLILPKVGLKAHTPQNAAGTLTLPPTSVPSPIMEAPAPKTAPSPPDDPPGQCWRLSGLTVVPKIELEHA